MGNACCSANEATTAGEAKELAIPKQPAPGASDIPGPDAKAPTAPAASAPAAPPAAAPVDDKHYYITVDKSKGEKLGIDVDHSDGISLLVEQINEGLIADYNKNNPKQQVTVNDRIMEVNAMKDDVLQLVDECKKDKVLQLKIRRP
eukprot:TRINITY_DN40363_c0_g1_i1.p1 TRINITY_DN40363_c0_g1~~TRINITY_DN40363_c0_g1_i1.p1  ORF type:complete len:146 (+),score=50.99 TRINITY_DN40363_c0_g1_i1:103-540(+)